MEERAFELPMLSGRLRVTEVSDGWWQWVLLRPDGATVLGADILSGRGTGILANLEKGPSAGELDGQAVRWILSLFENHHFLYASDDGTEQVLHFQDRDGRIVWRDRLLVEHRQEWARTISAIQGTG
jgi:hypothetical protein